VPRIVDHDERRAEFMAHAWTIIARAGLGGVTLRSVAAASGMANGALKPYFRSKEHLMVATFEYVMGQVAQRLEADAEGLSGFDAVRAFSLQILPHNQQLVDEARVIIGFWALAAHDPAMAEVNDTYMGQWRALLSGWVREQEAETGFREGITVDILVDGLMTFLLGSQVTVTVDTVAVRPDMMAAHLEALLNTYLPDDVWWEAGRRGLKEAARMRDAG
jgi:AcrR family transcriptional regulator